MIRRARLDDIRDIVKVHSSALPTDLLPRLGDRYLQDVFYPTVISAEDTFLLIQERQGQICAFVMFAVNSQEVIRRATKRKLVFIGYVLAAALRDISLIREVFSHARTFKTEFHANIDCQICDIPELFVLATAPQHQSRGIGGKLLEQGIEELFKDHDKCLVKTSSIRAKAFYRQHQFREIGLEFRGNRRVFLLLRNRPDPSRNGRCS